ncbi:MAG: hypothetical protein K2X37_08735 [Chitinophagaceae bacterium]|nr:hypothetical protein [Chitinophagaceae bacterium]
MKSFKPTKLLTGLIVLVISTLTIYSCQKISEKKEVSSEFSNYNSQISSSLSNYFLVLIEKVKLKQKINFSDININLVSGLAAVKVIPLNSPKASQEYKSLFRKIISEVKKERLIHTSDYKNFITDNIDKLTNKDERQSAIFLCALGSSVSEFCITNFPLITTFFNTLSSQMDRYIDPSTGLFRLQIKPAGNTVSTILVAIIVVTAAIIAFPSALAVATGTLGLAGGWAVAFGIFGAIGAGAAAYAGACPPFLGQENCPLLNQQE